MDNSKSLVPVTGEAFTDLQEIKQKKYEEALRNLITGTTPKEVVFQRPARGGASVDYVPGWWFVEQLNALFGHFWDFEVLEQSIGTKQIWVKGKLTVKEPGTGMTVSKTAFGGCDIKFKRETSEIIDIGDDLKSATTDAMKKAATLLGLAADIYGQREKLDETAPNKSQLGALYKIGKDKGMSQEQVDDYCVKKHGSTPKELESIYILGLISELRNRANP